jgi:hypothetical protein
MRNTSNEQPRGDLEPEYLRRVPLIFCFHLGG